MCASFGPINEKHSQPDFPSDCECKVTPFPTQKLPIGSNATAYRHFIFLSLSYLQILLIIPMNSVDFFSPKALW